MIVLPFPPASLSGHAKGHWRRKALVTRIWRDDAYHAALAAKLRHLVPVDGDIRLAVHFYPADNRGDRTNYPNRCKPIFDGIADALRVNDRRFVPEYHFHEASKPGRLEIQVLG